MRFWTEEFQCKGNSWLKRQWCLDLLDALGGNWRLWISHSLSEKQPLLSLAGQVAHGSGGVRLSPLGTQTAIWLMYQSRTTDDEECGAVDGMGIGRGNRSIQRKPIPESLCPPQIPLDLGSKLGRRSGKSPTNPLSYMFTSLFISLLLMQPVSAILGHLHAYYR
jgi:hypothetical protein